MICKKIAYFSFFVALTILFSSCLKVPLKDIYGTYVAKYSFGIDKIVLKNDGTYFQEVKIYDDPKFYNATGKWKLGNDDEMITSLIIEDAFVVSDGYGRFNENFQAQEKGLSRVIIQPQFISRKLELITDEMVPHIKVD